MSSFNKENSNEYTSTQLLDLEIEEHGDSVCACGEFLEECEECNTEYCGACEIQCECQDY